MQHNWVYLEKPFCFIVILYSYWHSLRRSQSINYPILWFRIRYIFFILVSNSFLIGLTNDFVYLKWIEIIHNDAVCWPRWMTSMLLYFHSFVIHFVLQHIKNSIASVTRWSCSPHSNHPLMSSLGGWRNWKSFTLNLIKLLVNDDLNAAKFHSM
jgi:hypothetical protein